MTVLLTGATGFIGSHLARLLVARGQDVVAVIKPSSSRWRIADVEHAVRVVECDLQNREAIVRAFPDGGPDVCIHLAWHGWSGPSLTAEENLSSVAASAELLRALVDIGCQRFVGVGTCFEYEAIDGILSETAPARPADLYGVCKHSVAAIAQALSHVSRMQAAWARVFLVYGPFDDRRRLVPSLTLSLLRGEVARMTRGEQIRDVLHVEDAASAIWAVATSAHVGPINIASGVPVTVAEIAGAIGAIVGRPELLALGALPYRPSEPKMLVADPRLLNEQVGWLPRHTLTTGLTDAVNWWRSQVARERDALASAPNASAK
jgi:nucleoside-diphosphate-sugar epimerase